MDFSPIKPDTIRSPTIECQTVNSPTAEPRPATKDLNKDELPAIENLCLHQPITVHSSKEYIETLRSLENALGQLHQGVQGRSTMLKELRTDFSDFKKEVQAIERLLKSKRGKRRKN
ncbi:hypothetical protein ACQKWADRAFT_269077 [Trichoderma austrokoningii]